MVKKYISIAHLQKDVKKEVYMGDFIIVAGVPYQMVEYSWESYKKGSRWVTYYNPITKYQIDIDYQKGEVDMSESSVIWEDKISFDTKFLKKRYK